MSSKAPIYLKRGSRKGKKEKLRDILSSDMISPPLGDFRHTIHIGSGGGEDDVFGDLSFLQGKFHLLPGRRDPDTQERSPGRPASVCGHPLSCRSSPLLKNALSLPIMEAARALTLPTPNADHAHIPPQADHAHIQPQAPPPKPPRLHLDGRRLSSPPMVTRRFTEPSPDSRAGLPSEERCLLRESCLEDRMEEQPYLSHAGSLLSLHLDLGPSILDDVLQIMDKHDMDRLNGSCLHGGLHEIFT